MADVRGGGGLPEEIRFKLYGLHKQVKAGPALGLAGNPEGLSTNLGPSPTVSPKSSSMFASSSSSSSSAASVAAMQLKAWHECGDMSADEAMRLFLTTLFKAAPYWKYQQFI